MAGSTSRPLRFLAALHRRAVVLRAVEQAGLGLLGGAVAAAGFTLLWAPAGRSVVPAAAALLATGATGGLCRGVLTRPSRLAAAARADEQLGTDDLLGTAAALSEPAKRDDPQPDPWARAVLGAAEQRCRTVSASAVVLRRLGGRAWGGIGLSAAAALTLALWVDPAGSTAGAITAPGTDQSVGRTPTDVVDRPLVVIAPEPRLRLGANPGPAEDVGSRSGFDNPDPTVSAPSGARPAGDPDTAPGASAAAGGDAADAGVGTSGYGTAATRPTAPAAEPDIAAAGPSTQPGTRRDGTVATRPAGGGLAAGSPPSTSDGTATPRAAGRTGSAAAGDPAGVPPWQAADWAADVRAAREQLDGGRVPPAYRDLVRQYFEVK